jgi:hypothetical protein
MLHAKLAQPIQGIDHKETQIEQMGCVMLDLARNGKLSSYQTPTGLNDANMTDINFVWMPSLHIRVL